MSGESYLDYLNQDVIAVILSHIQYEDILTMNTLYNFDDNFWAVFALKCFSKANYEIFLLEKQKRKLSYKDTISLVYSRVYQSIIVNYNDEYVRRYLIPLKGLLYKSLYISPLTKYPYVILYDKSDLIGGVIKYNNWVLFNTFKARMLFSINIYNTRPIKVKNNKIIYHPHRDDDTHQRSISNVSYSLLVMMMWTLGCIPEDIPRVDSDNLFVGDFICSDLRTRDQIAYLSSLDAATLSTMLTKNNI